MEKITEERVREIFEDTESKWEGDNAFKGLQIIAKYFDVEKTDILCWAGHDEICSVDIDEAIEAGMTEEDFTSLAKLNWMINSDSDSLACFV